MAKYNWRKNKRIGSVGDIHYTVNSSGTYNVTFTTAGGVDTSGDWVINLAEPIIPSDTVSVEYTLDESDIIRMNPQQHEDLLEMQDG